MAFLTIKKFHIFRPQNYMVQKVGLYFLKKLLYMIKWVMVKNVANAYANHCK